MSWITINEDDVKTRLTGAELDAFTGAALAQGQADPLPDIIASVTDRVRGYAAACARNRLGAPGTVPARLRGPALAVIRFELANRLPKMGRLIDDLRRAEYDNALRLFQQVAGGDFVIEDPDAATDAGARGPLPVSRRRRLNFDRRHQDGI
jgi:hypothetical protein